MGGRSVRRCLASIAIAAGVSLAATPPSLAVSSPLPRGPRHVTLPVPATTVLVARARASHLYRFELTGFFVERGKDSDPTEPTTEVFVKMSRPGIEADYSRSANLDPVDGMSVSFGGLGRVETRFVPRQVTRVPPTEGCDRGTIVEHGVLRGTIAFRGEGGYASLDVGALPATLTRRPATVCRLKVPRTRDSNLSGEGVRFGGDRFRRSGRSIGFTVSEHPRLGTAGLLAYASEQRGPISIARQVKATVAARDAPFDQDVGTASVAAPVPFTGSARYRAFPGRESGTWLGPLAVDFPGLPGIHLAGRGFKGSLISGDECGPDEPGSFCSYAKVPSPIGLGPIRTPE